MNHDALIQEVKDNFDHAVQEWADIRKEGAKDMKYRAGDPWSADERLAREKAKRHCLTFDELAQYCNQTINTARQNKRAVKVVPSGNGATDETAETRAAMIRGIEYKSKAAAAYITAFEGSIERSYGYVKLTTQWEGPRSRNQELAVRPVPNPDVIYLDPDAKLADWSDGEYAFEIDTYRNSKFRSRWPGAKIQSFGSEHQKMAPAWIKDGGVQVAAYWKLTKNKRDLVFFENGESAFVDEIEGAKLTSRQESETGLDRAMCALPDGRILQVETRASEDPKVTQYITNGLEILEETPWAGKRIPIFPCFGKALYVPDEGGASKLHLLSLIRLARDPYMSYCYIRTCEAEVAGMVPKAIYVGYEGQFDTSTDWANINRNNTPFAEVKARTTSTGEQILPLPARQNWEPAIQGLEIMAESAKRAIQSAMGMGATTVGRQDPSTRSGVAIKELNAQADTGNYHFTDALDAMIESIGQEMDACLPAIYDTDREVGTRNQEDEYEKVRINAPVMDEKTGEESEFLTSEGDHDVTITTGPSNDSQREEVNEFASTLVQMPNAPPKAIAIAIKLRNLGPLGDKLAECWDPPQDEVDPAAAAQKMAALEQLVEQQTATIHDLNDEIDFKKEELEVKRFIAEEQEKTKRMLGLAGLQQADAIEMLRQEVAAVRQDQTLRAQAEQQQAAQDHESQQAQTAQEHQTQAQQAQQAHEAQQAEAAAQPQPTV